MKKPFSDLPKNHGQRTPSSRLVTLSLRDERIPAKRTGLIEAISSCVNGQSFFTGSHSSAVATRFFARILDLHFFSHELRRVIDETDQSEQRDDRRPA